MRALEVGLIEFEPLIFLAGSGQAPAERRRTLVESAVLAERLGFDSWWLAAHSDEQPPPSPALLLAAIAARTERLRLGACATLADHELLRLAEDVATLDGISGGRVELSVMHGNPSGLLCGAILFREEEARRRYWEGTDLLCRLWTETGVSWSGRIRPPLEDITVEPRPVQQPHPPLWVDGSSLPCAERAGELGLPLMLRWPRHAQGKRLAESYRERAARAGKPARVGAWESVVFTDSLRQARETWWAERSDSLRIPVELLEGTPCQVADAILMAREVLGLDLHLSCLGGGDVASEEDLVRFAHEVLPALRAS